MEVKEINLKDLRDMKAKELMIEDTWWNGLSEKWCEALNGAQIGDVITIEGMSIKVVEEDGTYCEGCDFNQFKFDGSCCLTFCDCVTPCSPWNNCLAKGEQYKMIKQ